MIVALFAVIVLFIAIIGGIVQGTVQYINVPKPPKGLSYKEYRNYYYYKEWQQDGEEIEDIHESERIMLLDETIIKYNKLLDNLTEQYNNTYDDKQRSIILSKQIVTLEKLNKALEKRERLE